MTRPKKIAHQLLPVLLFASLPFASIAGSTGRSPYNPRAVVTYDEIYEFEVRSFPLMMAHPYQVVIPNTSLGQVIACRIYQGSDVEASSLPDTPGASALLSEGSDGVTIDHRTTSRDMQFVDSGNPETHVHFSHKISDAVFRCFNVHIELKDR
ncbi:hypothetical protein [Ruegeria atlantica]|uniref:hypothetical protein n=1 Tax=Ruegeria atlantica TaxID=81569 RepID=UPI00147EA673|nr:hypothetical protein [Ruegeria atlantica]